jgi:hypothetical protein
MMGRIAALLVVTPLMSGLILLAGCGSDPDKPKLARVSGKVTYKGKAISPGSVTFNPVGGGEQSGTQIATGQLDSDGSFSLTTFNTGDGAVIGQHVVTIDARGEDINQINQPKDDGTIAYVLPQPLIPEKYTRADQSPLRYTVEEDKDNYFDIVLEGSLTEKSSSRRKGR